MSLVYEALVFLLPSSKWRRRNAEFSPGYFNMFVRKKWIYQNIRNKWRLLTKLHLRRVRHDMKTTFSHKRSALGWYNQNTRCSGPNAFRSRGEAYRNTVDQSTMRLQPAIKFIVKLNRLKEDVIDPPPSWAKIHFWPKHVAFENARLLRRIEVRLNKSYTGEKCYENICESKKVAVNLGPTDTDTG
jgi:hypothetical protein